MLTNITRRTLSSSTLIGDEVVNRAGETVGSLHDIMLDLEEGRVAYAVVSSGGFLGFGDRLFAVPWHAMELDGERHAFIVDVDKERLEHAPGFDKDHWPDMTDRTWGQEVHEFYGVAPYWD
ncbi:MAG: PRC-barrel domain-containing protein [Planctomycetaceae bacterium]|nr:PRC-barrel domain-containing protein [Planctomycetaceae bacterium]